MWFSAWQLPAVPGISLSQLPVMPDNGLSQLPVMPDNGLSQLPEALRLLYKGSAKLSLGRSNLGCK